MAFTANGLLVTGTYQRLFLLEPSSFGLQSQFRLPEAYAWRHIDLEGTDSILSISKNGPLRLWNTRNWSYRDAEIPIGRPICSLAYSRRSEVVAIGLESGEIIFWNPTAAKPARKKPAAPKKKAAKKKKAKPVKPKASSAGKMTAAASPASSTARATTS